VEAQRARLAGLRSERDQLRVPPLATGRRGFSARWVELDPDAPRDASVRDRLTALDRRINEHNRTALADRTPPPVAEGEPHYVGSDACASCHAPAHAWWRSHPHGHAYETLASRDKQFHLDCVGCHVTGYERPGGSTVTQLGDGGVLRDVGCENCHGPGSAHLTTPTAATITRDAPESLCVRCHNEEHSDRFVYDAYRATLLVPGHGRPVSP
jgi:predicted CXXCH cytochrome family protein